jgi:hypothetical protein
LKSLPLLTYLLWIIEIEDSVGGENKSFHSNYSLTSHIMAGTGPLYMVRALIERKRNRSLTFNARALTFPHNS